MWAFLGELQPDQQWRSFSASQPSNLLRLTFAGDTNKLFCFLLLRRAWNDEVFQAEKAYKIYPSRESAIVELPAIAAPFSLLNPEFQVKKGYRYRKWGLMPEAAFSLSLEAWF